MSVTKTVDIPDSHRLTIDVPYEIPTGRAILTFTAAETEPEYRTEPALQLPLPGGHAHTVEEALEMAAKKAADPNRKPISRHFGTCKGFFGGDGVAYQRKIRDEEWDD